MCTRVVWVEHADLCSAYIDHRGLIGGGLFVAKTTFPSTPVNSPGGYKSVPQWMNDKAHCLKCDAVVKTRNSIHGEVPVPENVQKDLGASRLPGEVGASCWPPKGSQRRGVGYHLNHIV